MARFAPYGAGRAYPFTQIWKVDSMSDLVYIKGPNGLVIGFPASVASGLLKHPDHKKVDGPKAVEPAPAPPTPSADEKPAGNASTEAWHAYALAHGKTSADLDGLKQGEIRALFSE